MANDVLPESLRDVTTRLSALSVAKGALDFLMANARCQGWWGLVFWSWAIRADWPKLA
jgi:hypothetical protein